MIGSSTHSRASRLRGLSVSVALRSIALVAALMVFGCASHEPLTGPDPNAGAHAVVRVYGAVNEPGWLWVPPPATLERAIAIAGGITTNHTRQGTSAYVHRRVGTSIKVGRDRWSSFQLYSDDVVTVPKRVFP